MALRVLVVDDDPMVLDTLSDMLEALGCTVVTATTAREALAKIADDDEIEALLTDVNMPGTPWVIARSAYGGV